jgi:ATP-dependent Clp protease adapter protein ClpS
MIQFNSRLLSKRRKIKERKNIDVLLSSDAYEAQGFFYEGGDDHALVVFRDGDENETNDGIPWDVVGDAMGASEQLELRRSKRVRDLHDEEFESDKEDEEEDPDSDTEVIAFEDDENDMDVVTGNNYMDEE